MTLTYNICIHNYVYILFKFSEVVIFHEKRSIVQKGGNLQNIAGLK